MTKVFVLLGQGLIFLVTGVLLGSALFLLGRRAVRRRWQKERKIGCKIAAVGVYYPQP